MSTMVDLFKYPGSATVTVVLRNKAFTGSGASATAAMVDLAGKLPRNYTVLCPKAGMHQAMKAGDIVSTGGIDGHTNPAYNSSLK